MVRVPPGGADRAVPKVCHTRVNAAGRESASWRICASGLLPKHFRCFGPLLERLWFEVENSGAGVTPRVTPAPRVQLSKTLHLSAETSKRVNRGVSPAHRTGFEQSQPPSSDP